MITSLLCHFYVIFVKGQFKRVLIFSSQPILGLYIIFVGLFLNYEGIFSIKISFPALSKYMQFIVSRFTTHFSIPVSAQSLQNLK